MNIFQLTDNRKAHKLEDGSTVHFVSQQQVMEAVIEMVEERAPIKGAALSRKIAFYLDTIETRESVSFEFRQSFAVEATLHVSFHPVWDAQNRSFRKYDLVVEVSTSGTSRSLAASVALVNLVQETNVLAAQIQSAIEGLVIGYVAE